MIVNQNFLNKCYMLEFQMNNGDSEIFTFALPPQGEQFDLTQRINETKTFNGSVIDDYGNDLVSISLNGSTFNNEVKMIYSGLLGNTRFETGEEEIFHLKRLLDEAGDLKRIGENKAIYLYSLQNIKDKSYRVWVKSFSIKRSKDSPFAYNYTLQFLGKKIEKKSPPTLASKIKNFLTNSKISEFADAVMQYASTLSAYVATVVAIENDIGNTIQKYINCLDALVKQVTGISEVFANPVIGSLDSISSVVRETTGVLDTFSWRKITNITDNLSVSVDNLKDAALEVVEWFDNQTEKDVPAEDTSKYNVSSQDYLDSERKVASDFLNLNLSFYRDMKQSINSTGLAILPPTDFDYTNINKDDTVVRTYGYKTSKAHDGDTWDQLSQQIYNTADYGAMLQIVNKSVELKAGTEIKYPNLTENPNFASNQILNFTDSVDNYGQDIQLVDGDFSSTPEGDLSVTSGTSTLSQAIQNRLNSSISTRIRNIAYGIKSIVGLDTTLIEPILLNSIKTTLDKEPRIEKIEKINYEGKGLKIEVNIDYVDINGNKASFNGSV